MISGLSIVAFVFVALALPEQAASFFGRLRPALTSTFDWFFLLVGNIFVLVALALVVSPRCFWSLSSPSVRRLRS